MRMRALLHRTRIHSTNFILWTSHESQFPTSGNTHHPNCHPQRKDTKTPHLTEAPAFRKSGIVWVSSLGSCGTEHFKHCTIQRNGVSDNLHGRNKPTTSPNKLLNHNNRDTAIGKNTKKQPHLCSANLDNTYSSNHSTVTQGTSTHHKQLNWSTTQSQSDAGTRKFPMRVGYIPPLRRDGLCGFVNGCLWWPLNEQQWTQIIQRNTK